VFFRSDRLSFGCTALAAALVLAGAATALAETPLLEAARRDDGNRVAALLRGHPDVNAKAADGSTALHWAAHHDDVALARLLLRAGARAGSADDTGATPLFLACMNRSDVMVVLLLDAGADANAALINGETALMTCSRTGDARTRPHRLDARPHRARAALPEGGRAELGQRGLDLGVGGHEGGD